jgi:DNA-binding NtrC family response regulator
MKNSSKIRSIKTIVLSQLLLGSLCISAHADWNWSLVSKAKSILWELSYPGTAEELENIVQWTLAASRIAAETLGNTPDPETKEKTEQIRARVWQLEGKTRDMMSRIGDDSQSAGFFAEDIQQNAQAAQDNFRAALDLYYRTRRASENPHHTGTGYW